MRVALVTEHLRRPVPGGIGTYIRGLLKGSVVLPERNVWLEPRQARLPRQLVSRAWDRGLLAQRGSFDVVHAPALAFPPTPHPLVVTVHGLEWRDRAHGAPERARRWHEAALARAVASGALLLASTPELAAELRLGGARRVTALDGALYGCDHLPPPDASGATELLDRLEVGERFLLSVGTLEPRKNLARLAAAYELVRGRLPERLPLVLVGPTGWGQELPPADSVILAGHVDDAVLAALYARAVAVAYVPLHEGFGLPAVEAMRAGAPVVASRVPSVGDAALVVDPTDVDAIAAALLRVVTDGDARGTLVAAGRAHSAGLTWAAAAERHAGLWSQVHRGTR
jgi:glycosyltransferase involved in cell wall biosynthesis